MRRVVQLRVTRRWAPARIAVRLGTGPSTVGRVLARYSVPRLSDLDRASGRVVRRYERDHPGALIHVDVKKLGRIPDGGGHRTLGRAGGHTNRARAGGGSGYGDSRLELVLNGTLNKYVVFNMTSPNANRATSKLKVRQAVAYPLNKKGIGRVYGGPKIARTANTASGPT